jgi:hypothetical protein
MSGPGQAVLPQEDQAALAVEGRLLGVAQQFEGALRERVTRLLFVAAEAILKLADLDLVRHEADDERGGHTLALWEELAPVMGSTVQQVNEVIANATAQFPSEEDEEASDDLDAAFGPDGGAAPREQPPGSTEEQIAQLAAAVCSGMRRDVARLGERLRNPTVVSDAWMLIQDLLEFRGRVRAALGELIYQVCSFVAEVDRQDVIPGYLADLEASLMVREATANLAFLFRGHARRVGSAESGRIAAALRDALKDLHGFSRTRALPQLRTSDKRIFLETRAALHRLSKASQAPALEIRQAVENLARFLDSLSVVSRRENLRLHDRAQLARAGRHVEAAQLNLETPERALEELVLAVRAASTLYGRDAQLDVYLRAQRHFPAEWLHDPEIAIELERLGALLAAVAQP